MASAAEQLASSITLANFNKATELKKRLWFTIGALILFSGALAVLVLVRQSDFVPHGPPEPAPTETQEPVAV